MNRKTISCSRIAMAILGVVLVGMAPQLLPSAGAQEKPPSSYAPVVVGEDFASTVERMRAAKPSIRERHMELLEGRYNLSDRPARGVAMARGKDRTFAHTRRRVPLPSGRSWNPSARVGTTPRATSPQRVQVAQPTRSSRRRTI